MGYMDTINWNEIKKDLQKGYEKGMAAIKKGAIVARKKAGQLTEEGKRQYEIVAVKSKIHQAISDLGARTYVLLAASGAKNPAVDDRVKDLMARIKKLEEDLARVQGSAGTKARPAAKAGVKKKAAR